MDNTLFSPLLSSANTIAGNKRTLTKKATDYQSFINFLNASNKDLKKIKLPSKRKVKNLANDIELRLGSGGGGGFNPVKMLTDALIGGAEGVAGGLGLRGLMRGLRGGKNAAKAAEEGENIFTKVNKAAQTTEKIKPGVRPANNIVEFDRKALRKGATELTEKEGGKVATQVAERGALKVGGGLVKRALPLVGAFFSTAAAIDDIKKGNFAGAGLNAISAVADIFGQSEISLATAAGAIGTELTYKGSSKDKLGERLKTQEKKQREAASKKLTLADVVNKFDKVVSKFEKISFGISGAAQGTTQTSRDSDVVFQEPDTYPTITPPGEGEKYKGPISGDTFFPLPGGEEGKQADQQFGAPRSGHIHAGLDLVKWSGDLNAPVVAYKTGRVYQVYGGGGDIENTGLAIDHGNGLITRYFHVNRSVNVGDIVYGGQQIGTLIPWGEGGNNTHLHFEIIPGKSAVDPLKYGTGNNRIPAPLSTEDAKKQSSQSTKAQGAQATPDVSLDQSDKIFDKLRKAKPGSGETIKIPGVGSVVKGTNLLRMPETKYFTPEGKQITDAKAKAAFETKENEFFKNQRQKALQQTLVSAAARQIPSLDTPSYSDSTTPTSNTIIVNNQPQTQQAAPQVVPIPIPTGGGGGGSSAMGGNSLVGEVVNSFAKLILLTNLSGS